ncbi:MAG: glycosyltransferase family A protein [Planctomycetota bacterium]|nr:glycosyltransferase family A protein [Planctomycetota bacterium]
MIALLVLCWIAIATALLTQVVWVVVGWRLNRALGTGLGICQYASDEIEEESVSIIVPAHNEARIIEQCARSLMNQQWSNLEIIFVADRCTDDTVQILRETTATDDRVRIIENSDCPKSWAGKCHAARLGAAGACGRYLVFMDADTLADSGLIRAAVASAKARGSSLLSLLTKLTTQAIYERRTQAVASMLLLTLYPPDRVNREESSRPFANGQFMLFDRDWYEKIGGHEAVQEDLLEDIAFARRIAADGGRVHLLSADGLLECSMYSSSKAFRRGWQRIFIESCRRKPDRMKRWAMRLRLLGVAGPFGCFAGVFLGAVTWGLGELGIGVATLVLSAVALLIQAGVLAAVYRSFHQTAWNLWRFPMGCEDLARILREGAQVLKRGEPVMWGGRSYILEAR